MKPHEATITQQQVGCFGMHAISEVRKFNLIATVIAAGKTCPARPPLPVAPARIDT